MMINVLFVISLALSHVICEALPFPWDTTTLLESSALRASSADHGAKAKRLLIDHDGGVDDLIALMLLLAVPRKHGELVGVIVTEVRTLIY